LIGNWLIGVVANLNNVCWRPINKYTN